MAITGKEIKEPYLTKSMNVYRVSCLFTNEVNMIPARAPVGVKKAPILLPTIDANVIALFEHIDEQKIDIGILLIRLEATKEVNPYVQMTLFSPNSFASSLETPW